MTTCPKCGSAFWLKTPNGSTRFMCFTWHLSDGTVKQSERCQLAELTARLAAALRERDEATATGFRLAERVRRALEALHSIPPAVGEAARILQEKQ